MNGIALPGTGITMEAAQQAVVEFERMRRPDLILDKFSSPSTGTLGDEGLFHHGIIIKIDGRIPHWWRIDPPTKERAERVLIAETLWDSGEHGVKVQEYEFGFKELEEAQLILRTPTGMREWILPVEGYDETVSLMIGICFF